jgi:hypothetical protein
LSVHDLLTSAHISREVEMEVERLRAEAEAEEERLRLEEEELRAAAERERLGFSLSTPGQVATPQCSECSERESLLTFGRGKKLID